MTDAWWDEANTGIKTCEIVFDNNDNFAHYKERSIENDFEFSIAKVPVGNTQLIHCLEDDGYRYLENQIIVVFEVSQVGNIYEKWHSKLDSLSCLHVKGEEQINKILDEVKGDMFQYDRYSIDPFWKDGVSSQRYIRWIGEMYFSGKTDFYLMKRGEEEIGFFSLKRVSESISSCPIAGIYPRYQKHGYFLALAYLWLRISSEQGFKKLTTAISTNNLPIHSFLSGVFSFKIEQTFVVLRKVLKR